MIMRATRPDYDLTRWMKVIPHDEDPERVTREDNYKDIKREEKSLARLLAMASDKTNPILAGEARMELSRAGYHVNTFVIDGREL